jgi:DNA-binding response OmpR family regulator
MSANPKTAVLVVEDEESIRRGLCDVLAYRGYAPEGVERGDDGLRRGLSREHALVLLDVMLPGMSGFDVCRELRGALPQLPILMLTARGAEQDVLDGFRAGADDYVTKPFSVAELCARVEALLRRSGASPGDEHAPPFAFGPWQIERATRTARRDGQSVELTALEAALAALFAREPGRILSRRRLLQEVWDVANPDRIETRTVDMHVAKLRRKLGAAGDALIQTVRGEGYRFTQVSRSEPKASEGHQG